LFRAVCRTVAVRQAGELTDGDLLGRFSRDRDEAAFAALVQRHGPLVLGVCRRVLHDPNDADDAFQATFFVLARKAGSVSQPDRLANWLYGVALRVAQKARSAAARRQARHEKVSDIPGAESSRDVDWNDLRQVLDDEVQHLPEKFRLPILLCYLQGKTREEAARQLGWSPGAVKGMLERGRELLRSRLTRRGVTLSATGLAGLLSENALSAAVPAVLTDSTVKGALLFALGNIAGHAAALAEGVLQAMWGSKMKLAVVMLLALAVVGTGAGVLAFGKRPAEPEPAKKAVPAARADPKKEQRKRQVARLDAARSAYKIAWLRFQAGREPEQTVTLWSRRWLQAQFDLSDRKADRDAALRAHRDRLAKVDDIARARLDLGNYTQPGLERELNLPDDTALLKTFYEEHFEAVWKDFRNGKASPEQVCQASVFWLVNQVAHGPGKKKPQADPKDLQAHLDRLKKIEKIVRIEFEAGRRTQLDLDTVKFYRLLAEEWLATGKTFGKDVLSPGHRLDTTEDKPSPREPGKRK
jgi:RNA polymerase sigma factor (sigma-70 family)